MKPQGQPLAVDANESGSTLRFLIPVAILSGNKVTFSGKGRLAKRPLTPYYELFDEKGITYETTEGALPLTVSGTLQPGTYSLAGDVSSQFFTGLLMTLPLLDGDSVLRSTTPLESASYVDMTLGCLRQLASSSIKNGTAPIGFLAISTTDPGLMSSKVIIPRPLSGSRLAAWAGLSAARVCGRNRLRATKSSSLSFATWAARSKARRN